MQLILVVGVGIFSVLLTFSVLKKISVSTYYFYNQNSRTTAKTNKQTFKQSVLERRDKGINRARSVRKLKGSL